MNSFGNQMRYAVYAQNIPPKNRTSVTRNIHIPSRSAECCCSRLSKWCFSTGEWVLADTVSLLPTCDRILDAGQRAHGPRRLGERPAQLIHADRVLVRPADHHGHLVEVERVRRAWRL